MAEANSPQQQVAAVGDAVVAEATALATYCGSLDPAGWEAPSWCEGWSVHEVVSHLVEGSERFAMQTRAALAGETVPEFTVEERTARRQEVKKMPLDTLVDELVRRNTGFFDYLRALPAADLTRADVPLPAGLMSAGQVALLTGGSFRAGTYAKAEANIDVAPLPQGKKRATAIHGLANVIWAGTQSPGAALEWVKFLHSEEGETILGESGATIPAHSGLADLWLKANPDMKLQVFIDAVEYSQAVEDPPVGFQWQIAIQEVVIKGWNGEIPADQIAPQAAAAADAVL